MSEAREVATQLAADIAGRPPASIAALVARIAATLDRYAARCAIVRSRCTNCDGEVSGAWTMVGGKPYCSGACVANSPDELRATIARQAAEVAVLRAALQEIESRGHAPSWGGWYCGFCGTYVSLGYEPRAEAHRHDCPVMLARTALATAASGETT